MKRETYKGRKIKVVAGRGADWGYTRLTLNGVDMGKSLGNEEAALTSTRSYIDHADEVGVSSARYGAEWYAPGTFELCDEGHATEIGGECGHMWCVEQREETVESHVSVVEQPTPAVEAETTVQRYERLSGELHSLKRIHPGERTEEQREEIRALNTQLTEILSVPPAGYSVPKTVSDLVTFAQERGWLTSTLWTEPGYSGEPFLNVEIGRLVPVDERENYRGDRWHYKFTWHSRDCAPGKVRRFGQGLATTPDSPATHAAPSLKALRAVIEANSAACDVANVA